MTIIRLSIKTICLLVFTFILISSCSKKLYSQPCNDAQALNGYKEVKSDRTKKKNISVKLFYLDDIEKFLANKKTYDVWMQTKDNYPIKIGQYQLENKNKTDIYKVIAERPKKLFISEEVLENAVGPGIIVLNINY